MEKKKEKKIKKSVLRLKSGICLYGLMLFASVFNPGAAGADLIDLAESVHIQGGYPDTLHTPSENREELVPLYGSDIIPMPGELIASKEDVKKEERHKQQILLPASTAKTLSCMILAVAVLIIIIFFIWIITDISRNKPGYSSSGLSVKRVQKRSASEDETVILFRDPDALAASGDMEAAVTALIEKALSLTGWRPVGRERSLTAREVLSGLKDNDLKKTQLVRIVSTGEAVRFGGIPATMEIYQRMKSFLAEIITDNDDKESGSVHT